MLAAMAAAPAQRSKELLSVSNVGACGMAGAYISGNFARYPVRADAHPAQYRESMIQAVLLGALAQAALLLSGLAVYVVKVPRRVVGALAGYGAGALLGAIAFDLIPEGEELPNLEIAIWLLIGAAVFVLADRLVETRFGGESAAKTDPGPSAPAEETAAATSAGGPLGIVVGAVVDGVPESLIFGIQLAAGQGLSVAFVAAVFVSNIPQALAPSVDLAAAGWKPCAWRPCGAPWSSPVA